MYLKGVVSSIENNKVRVTFPDKDNTVSAPLKVASHIGELNVGDNVVVLFFLDNMLDGLILAQY